MRTRGSSPRFAAATRLACFLIGVLTAGWAPVAWADWVTDGLALCTHPASQHPAAIVTDGGGGAIVIWSDYRNGSEPDLYAQRVSGGGDVLWSANGVVVCTAVGIQNDVTAVPVGGGGAVVFWSNRQAGSVIDVYAQRIDGQGVRLWALNGLPLVSTLDDEWAPAPVSDRSSESPLGPPGWRVVFKTSGTEFPVQYSLRVQHVDEDGGLGTPASSGGTQLASVSAATTFTAVSDGVAATRGAPQGVVAVWTQGQFGAIDIYARRMDASGTPQWSSLGVPVCTLPGDQVAPAVVNVGNQTVIAWLDTRDGVDDIYAQKLNSLGAAQWSAGGLPVCTASGIQSPAGILADAAGGVFLVWSDSRGSQTKVYAQRLDASGQPLWDVDGIPVCPATGNQTHLGLVSDGAGGLIIAWTDNRASTEGDLYAQRLDANGTLLWPATGVPLTTASGNQVFPQLIGDGQGGAIVTWPDQRAGNYDVYTNRVGSSGGIADAPARVPEPLRLALASPNPSRGDVRLRLVLDGPADVAAEVVDPMGRRVRSLQAGREIGAGIHFMVWDGATDDGAPAAAGLYFVHARIGAAREVIRIARLR